jgi:hypothetical protein
MNPAEIRRRRRANRFAAGTAIAVAIGATIVIILSLNTTALDLITKKTTETNEQTTAEGKAPGTVNRKVTEITEPADDTSLWALMFRNRGVVYILQFAFVPLAAFLAGAVVQRVMLGEYGISVGALSFPSLPTVQEDEAREALQRIVESPKLPGIVKGYPRDEQPLFEFPDLPDDRLAFINIRLEIEDRLRKLAEAAGLDKSKDVSKLIDDLREENILDRAAAKGLKEMILLGDRAMEGASVDTAVLSRARDTVIRVLYGLDELRRRVLIEQGGGAR